MPNIKTRSYPAPGVVQFQESDATQLPQLFAPPAPVALAGSGQGDASGTVLGTGTNGYGGAIKLTGADGTKGGKLPPSTGGIWVLLFNPDPTNAAKVYPATMTGAINNGAAGAALSVPPNTACIAVAMDGVDNWRTIPRTPA